MKRPNTSANRPRRNNLKYPIIVSASLAVLSLQIYSCRKETTVNNTAAATTEMKVQLGRRLFFDKGLSNPVGQACATCHAPATGFSDPTHDIVSAGATDGLFGNRNAPNIAYVKYAPVLQLEPVDSFYFGGFFLDGRVNSLEEQAKQPFLNVLEMGNTDAAMVVAKLKASENYTYYTQTYGAITDVNKAFGNVVDAIATYERSDTLNSFTSKYDYYLKGQATLTAQELSGMKLFTDTLKGNCAFCHKITPDPTSGKVLFTDFSYENIGVPKNPSNPFYTISAAFNPAGLAYVDLGLGGFLKDHAYDGMFKTPTLRNSAISAPYFHNGYFNTLEEVVHFYNMRDSASAGFAAPEVGINIDHFATGNQHLTVQEEHDVAAFLKTLTDGYQ